MTQTSTFEAFVTLTLTPTDKFDRWTTEHLVALADSAELGVRVIDIKAPAEFTEATQVVVHVSVTKPEKFEIVKNDDFLRINLTDPEFGMQVDDVRVVVRATN